MAEYITNDEAVAIADSLIPEFHPRLIGLKIAHLLKVMPIPKPKKNAKPPRHGKKITLAKISKVSAKTNAIVGTDFQFVVEYGSLYWDNMPDAMKRAVVDHELCHAGNDADGTYLISHTIEDFSEIFERYGCWKSDVEQFVKTVIEKVHKDAKFASALGE